MTGSSRGLASTDRKRAPPRQSAGSGEESRARAPVRAAEMRRGGV